MASKLDDEEAELDMQPVADSKKCSPDCRCMSMTLAEIRDNCTQPWVHQLLAYISKLLKQEAWNTFKIPCFSHLFSEAAQFNPGIQPGNEEGCWQGA